MDHHWRAFILLLFFSFVICSCSEKKSRQVVRSYYYWRSGGYVSNEEKKFLRDHQVQKLYVRLMDIDWSEVHGAIPVSKGEPYEVNYQVNHYDSVKTELVPVVFLTNKTFERIDSADIPQLAKRIVRRCLPSYDAEDIRYEKEHHNYWAESFSPKEVQFDCDWTTSTRNKYFHFLSVVKHLLPSTGIRMSATIRLHQYKYPDKTGVPPVDRGMLMVYNISDLRQYSEVNSIYDDSKAKAYFTSSGKYRLPLDIVLPAYSWCIVFRERQFYQIENGLSEKELKQLSFLEKKKNGFYAVKEDTVYRDLFLRPGDEIKPEGIDSLTLQQAASLARKAVNTDSFTVAFFELSEPEIANYSYENIESIYRTYR